MPFQPDIRESVINTLTEESFKILTQAAKEQPGVNGGHYAWFQKLITHAEVSGNQARAMAGVIVMKAYGETLTSSDPEQLESRVRMGIQDMVSGR